MTKLREEGAVRAKIREVRRRELGVGDGGYPSDGEVAKPPGWARGHQAVESGRGNGIDEVGSDGWTVMVELYSLKQRIVRRGKCRPCTERPLTIKRDGRLGRERRAQDGAGGEVGVN